MTAGAVSAPQVLEALGDRLLLAEREDWAQGRVSVAPGALLLVRAAAQGDVLFARGEAGDVGDLLAAESALRRRESAEPALWLSAPRGVVVPAWVLDVLGLTPFSHWDWMASDVPPAIPAVGASIVLREVDRADHAEVSAVREVLRAANPRSTADPQGPHEASWWAAFADGEVVGAIGARRELGGVGDRGAGAPSSSRFSWHLHGLGVLPSWRGRGLGAALTAAPARAGLEAGADWISLGIYAENDVARRLYHRLGFTTEAEMSSYGPATATRPLR